MMKHAFVAAVAAALSLAACTAAVDETEPVAAEGEALATFGKSFVGAFQRVEGTTGYAHLVLKSDSTYFGEVNVVCIKAPCNPVHQEGKWTSRAKSGSRYEGSLTLRPTGGTAVTYTADLATEQAGFMLTRGNSFMRFERVDAATYCSQNTDCAGQPTPVNRFACMINTAPQTVCATDSHACVAKCMPIINDPCASFACPTGQHCTAPADAPYCVANISRDPCANFSCPTGQHCTAPADAPYCTP